MCVCVCLLNGQIKIPRRRIDRRKERKKGRKKERKRGFFFFLKEIKHAKLQMTGGPGCSSELAVFFENGPCTISAGLSLCSLCILVFLCLLSLWFFTNSAQFFFFFGVYVSLLSLQLIFTNSTCHLIFLSQMAPPPFPTLIRGTPMQTSSSSTRCEPCAARTHAHEWFSYFFFFFQLQYYFSLLASVSLTEM